jgi:hypothetical protein
MTADDVHSIVGCHMCALAKTVLSGSTNMPFFVALTTAS